MMRPCHKFVDFVLENNTTVRVGWELLSAHEEVIDALIAHPEFIDWNTIWSNPAPKAVALFERNWSKLNAAYLSANPNDDALRLLLTREPDRIDWYELSRNPCHTALRHLRANPQHILWGALSSNVGANAGALLRSNLSCLDWGVLSRNGSPAAMALLKEYPENIHWRNLSCYNPSEEAMELLHQHHTERFSLDWVSANRSVYAQRYADSHKTPSFTRSHYTPNLNTYRMEGIKFNPWPGFARKHRSVRTSCVTDSCAIQLWNEFVVRLYPRNSLKLQEWIACATAKDTCMAAVDYAAMREQMRPMREDLYRYVMHPSRIGRLCGLGLI
jgi:hypothetical protein